MKWTPPKEGNRRVPRILFDENDVSVDNSNGVEISLEDANNLQVLGQLGALSSHIMIPQNVEQAMPREIQSSLPATQKWPGKYGFNMTFSPPEGNAKTITWTYSPSKDKLYVVKGVACPINFSTNVPMLPGLKIRATAFFTMAEHVSQIVHRCYNHAMEESNRNIFEADHLIRCESDHTIYEENVHSKRHSVLVPFENPPAGAYFSTYIFKFMCFSSCAGGPNRRAITVVFTLEKNEEVLGRQKVELKICACPMRDRKTDEQVKGQVREQEQPISMKRKDPPDSSTHLVDTFNFINSITYPAPKKSRNHPPRLNAEGYYQLTVRDPQCFDFLKQMKRFYEICQTMRNMPTSLKKTLFYLQNRRNDSSKEESE